MRSTTLSHHLAHSLFAALTLSLSLASHAAGKSKGFSVEKTDTGGAVITHNGQPFATYVVDQANKPYLYPVYGPTGKMMTRNYPMKNVEGERQDHPHHRGINFGHEDIGGFNTWAERRSFEELIKKRPQYADRLKKVGNIRHKSYLVIKADADKAVLVTENDYVGPDGKKAITEIRTMTFRVETNARLIDWDQEFIATEGEVTLADRKDSGLSIRVPTSMDVDSKKGGHIITSAGITDKAAWGTRAKWVDYNGPVDGETLGVAILNHPTSFRHPTSWHVRTYGLFTANPFGTLKKDDPNGPHTLKKGDKLRLRHRFILHKGDDKQAGIAAAFERYSKEK